MPGLNIYLGDGGERFSVEGVSLVSNIFISKDLPYPHYPIVEWESEDFQFFLEGYFFEERKIKEKIEALSKEYFSGKSRDAILKRYFADSDAEFILLVFNKVSKKVLIVNDVLGRLPLYFFKNQEVAIISRNIRFFYQTVGLELNSQAALETLSLGFTLGDKTLFNGISRIAGGSYIELVGNEVNFNTYNQFNFESIIDEQIAIPEFLEASKGYFLDAIKSRSSFGDLNIVTLTGGLDSRAVAGGIKQAALPYQFASFVDIEGNAKRDLRIATQIARKHEKDIEVFNLGFPDRNSYESFFYKKFGISSWDMAFIAPFFESLARLSSAPIMFTGDGGDKVFPDLRPGTFCKSIKSLANYSINKNSRLPVAYAADILGVNQKNLFEEVERLLLSYPEVNPDYKFVRFTMENRVNNWLIEGEDRNRCFLTSFTPFYHIKLFKALMSVPYRHKEAFQFYYKFLKLITPETADIVNANWGFDLKSRNKIRWIEFKQCIKNTELGLYISNSIKSKSNHFRQMDEVQKGLFQELVAYPEIKKVFKLSGIQAIPNLSSDNILYLMTLMKIVSIQGKF